MKKKNHAQPAPEAAAHSPKPKQAVPKRQISSAPPRSAPALPPITLTLGAVATRLVRWYCQLTHHQEADAIEDALVGTLERAQAAYQEDAGIDEAFEWLLGDVSSFLRSGDRQSRLPWRGGTSLQLSPEASLLLHQRRQSHEYEDPRDVASGAVILLLGSRPEGASRSLEECIREACAQRASREADDHSSPSSN